jgi:hypothetical protein
LVDGVENSVALERGWRESRRAGGVRSEKDEEEEEDEGILEIG